MKQEDISAGISLFETTGFSMSPFVRSEDKVLVRKVQAGQLRIGDIILYHRRGQKSICHRLVRKAYEQNRVMLYTRGDNTSGSDSSIPEDCLIGRAECVLRNGKILDLRSKKWILLNWFIAKGPFLIKIARKYFRGIVKKMLHSLDRQ